VRLCALILLVIGCGSSDPCDAFPNETCLSLEVRGPGLSVDQIALHATAGFTLTDGRSPKIAGNPFALPVKLAVVPGGDFAGMVELEVRGLLTGVVVGADQVHATVAAKQHLSIIAELGGSHASDLGGVDFSGIDLARGANDLAIPAGVDLAGSDLAVATGGFVPETSNENNTALMGVFGRSSTDVWAVALGGDIIHSGGDGSWQKQRTGAGGINETLFGLFDSGTDLFAFGGVQLSTSFATLLLHAPSGSSWSTQSFPGTDTNFAVEIHGIGGVGSNNFWSAVSGSTGASIRGALHSTDFTTWNKETANNTPDIQAPNSLYVGSAVGIYLVDSRIWRSTGNGSWSLQTLPAIDTPFLNGIHGVGDVDIWAVGFFGPFGMEKPLVLHSPGNNTWTQESLPTIPGSNLEAVFAVTTNDVWVVGDSSQILHFQNSQWTAIPSGSTQNLHAVWADSTDVYAVGEKGTIVHLRR
jgi:hypothetical protein